MKLLRDAALDLNLQQKMGSIAKVEAERFINEAENRFEYAKARVEAIEQGLVKATGAASRLGSHFKASSEAHLKQIYAETLPLVEKVKSATETITSNLGDYSDFVGETELSKLAVGASGVNIQDLSSSYWSLRNLIAQVSFMAAATCRVTSAAAMMILVWRIEFLSFC